MEPTTLLPAIALLSLVTVEVGGWGLLSFITTHRGELGPFREQFFRAGHAHAGVLLVLSVAAFAHLGRTDLGEGAQWAVGALLLGGVLAQSGGFFLHLGFGAEGRRSIGTTVTRIGGLAVAAALLVLAVASAEKLALAVDEVEGRGSPDAIGTAGHVAATVDQNGGLVATLLDRLRDESGSSRKLTSRTSRPRPRNSSYSALTEGNSFRQSGHHVAQKKSITTFPRRSASRCVRPARSGSSNAGAGLGGSMRWTCIDAKSGGAAAAAAAARRAAATTATVI